MNSVNMMFGGVIAKTCNIQPRDFDRNVLYVFVIICDQGI